MRNFHPIKTKEKHKQINTDFEYKPKHNTINTTHYIIKLKQL